MKEKEVNATLFPWPLESEGQNWSTFLSPDCGSQVVCAKMISKNPLPLQTYFHAKPGFKGIVSRLTKLHQTKNLQILFSDSKNNGKQNNTYSTV